ncbi:MAG TPA: HlyD family type I secretion periplasmic adaptor subunit [Burkholderiaceae bacterium]|nr:HlyD family type I secretion periplasmic adaptor subunit [Burkholderiaceae bacterium]
MNALLPSAGPMRRPTSLAASLSTAAPGSAQQAALRALRRRVLWPLAGVAGAVALWCFVAPLSGAVVATGRVQAEYGRKTVQHQEGGILRELLVRPGQTVRRGDPLLVVGDVRNDATLDLLARQRDAEQLRAARAQAELAMAPAVAWPPVHGAGEALLRERQLFEARRRTLLEQLAALEQQQHQAARRAAALGLLAAASDRSTALGREELGLNLQLVENGFIQKTRLMALERGVAELESRSATAHAQVAEVQVQAGALADALAQLRGSYRQRAADEYKAAATRVQELEDQLRPTRDLAQRQTVRAPVDGTVMSLRVSAPGTAVGPREPLLEIAPSAESLIVEVPVDPHDIDHVRQGGAAEVRLAAFDARRHPLLPATLHWVSPDAVADAEGRRTWYLAQVEVAAGELARHPQLRLQAGMPAEVFITTPARSLLEYLLEPLGLFAQRALREP